jgi:hypothetical protein
MRKLVLLMSMALMSVGIVMASQKRKVLFIGIDGVRADALQLANTPNIDTLVAHGAYTFDSWAMGITVSGPSWSTIFTGVWYPKHGITNNSYSGARFDKYMMFPKLAKYHKPRLYAAEVVEWPPLIDNVPNVYDGYDFRLKVPDGATTPTGAAVATRLLDTNLDVMTCYYDAVDLAGHSSGFSPSNTAYINTIQAVDANVGVVLNALRSRVNYANEDWLILLTTDHGGIGTGHGGNTNTERHIWWIAAGTNIRHRQLNVAAADPGTYVLSTVDTNVLKSVPVQADIAVTALHHLIYDLNLYPAIRTMDSLDGRSWLDSIYTPPATSVTSPLKSMLHDELVVYPNPVTDLVTLWFNSLDEQVSYSVVNAAGVKVKEMNQVEMTSLKLNIDLSGQPNGVYYLMVTRGKESAQRKIIIQH